VALRVQWLSLRRMPSAWPCAALAVFLIATLLYRSMSDGASEMTVRIVTSAGPLTPAPKVVPQELVAPLVHTADFVEHLVARASSLPPPLPPPPPSPSPRVRWCEHLAKPHECEHWYRLAQQMQQNTVVAPRVRLAARACTENCHGRGVCDPLLGVCNCYVGWNGTTCEGRSLRTCNGG
jgi:hypothetical protein